MANLFHILAIITGVLAYYFSDVDSNSSFTNTFLPFMVLLSFIYGVVVTINIIYKMRNKSREQDLSADILLSSLKGQVKDSTVNEKPAEIKSIHISDTIRFDASENKITEDIIIEEGETDLEGLDQDELNQCEWENPDNWGDSSWMDVYFSKNDSRVWVPKRKPILGKTLNLAQSASAFWILSIICILFFAAALLFKYIFNT